jgi:hypothetical protein
MIGASGADTKNILLQKSNKLQREGMNNKN